MEILREVLHKLGLSKGEVVINTSESSGNVVTSPRHRIINPATDPDEARREAFRLPGVVNHIGPLGDSDEHEIDDNKMETSSNPKDVSEH